MVVAPVRLETQSKGTPAGPAFVCPTTATARPGNVTVLAPGCRLLRVVQVGIDTARQLPVIPIPAPLEGVAMHIVQPPGVRRVTADLRGPVERRSRFAPVVRFAFEVRLLAAELVAE